MRYRRAAKKDACHVEIVDGLRACGYSVVEHHAAVVAGHPDITVGGHGFDQMMELKRPGVAGKKRGKKQAATNAAQAEFRARWRGRLIVVVETLPEALAVMARGR